MKNKIYTSKIKTVNFNNKFTKKFNVKDNSFLEWRKLWNLFKTLKTNKCPKSKINKKCKNKMSQGCLNYKFSRSVQTKTLEILGNKVSFCRKTNKKAIWVLKHHLVLLKIYKNNFYLKIENILILISKKMKYKALKS